MRPGERPCQFLQRQRNRDGEQHHAQHRADSKQPHIKKGWPQGIELAQGEEDKRRRSGYAVHEADNKGARPHPCVAVIVRRTVVRTFAGMRVGVKMRHFAVMAMGVKMNALTDQSFEVRTPEQ